ncbi:MAG: winged helix-turn-helix domain-containing protein [Myxococcota bacterium]
MSSRVLALSTCTVALDQRAVTLPTGETRTLTRPEADLLAALAEAPNVDVPRDALLRAVWPDHPVSERVVDTTIRRLREKLGDRPTPRHVLTVYGVGYRLALGAPTAAPATAAPGGRRVAVPTGTLDLGRFEFVPPDGATTPLTAGEVRALEVLCERLGATVPREALLARLWGRGQHDRALESLVGRLRAKLDRPPIRVLHTVVGVGFRLDGADPASRANLPVDGGAFLDRPERALLGRWLAEHRVTTVVGPAGIGKTRLARELGWQWLADHPEGQVHYCALASVEGETGFLLLVAAALGLGWDGEPATRIEASLRGLSADDLIVLDNFEQLLDCRGFVERWSRVSAATFLVTSREALGLAVERPFAVGPMEVSLGARLYVARAGDRFPLDDVRGLVARLDGVPLAIELAAARADRLPPRVFAERQVRPLDVLVRRTDAIDSQHATLRGAIDTSWDLMSDVERTVWSACAAFVAPWDAQAAAAISGVDDADQVLGVLASCSLVTRAGDRWSMLELLREYAAERATLLGSDALDRHARYFAALGDTQAARFGYGGPEMDRIREAHAELVAVVRRAADPRHRGLAARAVIVAGLYDGELAGSEEVVRLATERGVDDANRAVVFGAHARAAYFRGDLDQMSAWLARTQAAVHPGFRQDADYVTALCLGPDRPAEAAALLARYLDRSTLRAAVESALGYLHYAIPARAPEAREMVERVVIEAEALGDLRAMSYASRHAALFAVCDGAWHAARVHAEASVRRAVEAGWIQGQAHGLFLAMRASVEAGRSIEAIRLHEALEALDLHPESRSRHLSRLVVATAHLDLGDLDRARVCIESAFADDVHHRMAWAWLERLGGRPDLALDRLAPSDPPALDNETVTCAYWANAAGAAAELGRLDDADAWIARSGAATRPRYRLAAATVALARRRTRGEADAAAAEVRAVLAGLPLVRCDDGQDRPRPTVVSFQRTLLLRMLDG